MAAYGFAQGLIGMPGGVAKYFARAYDVNVGALSAVSAQTTSEQTVTISGLTTDDWVGIPNKPTHQAGLGIVGARVSAADTLAITFMNATTASITPTASQTYKVIAVRCAA